MPAISAKTTWATWKARQSIPTWLRPPEAWSARRAAEGRPCPWNASGTDGCQAPNTDGQEGVLQAEGDCGAGLRANQGGSWSAPVSSTGLGLGPSRMESDLYHP